MDSLNPPTSEQGKRLAELEHEMDTVLGENDTLRRALTQLQDHRDESEHEHEGLRVELDVARRGNRALEDQLEAQQGQADLMQRTIAELEDDVAAMQQERGRDQSRARELEYECNVTLARKIQHLEADLADSIADAAAAHASRYLITLTLQHSNTPTLRHSDTSPSHQRITTPPPNRLATCISHKLKSQLTAATKSELVHKQHAQAREAEQTASLLKEAEDESAALSAKAVGLEAMVTTLEAKVLKGDGEKTRLVLALTDSEEKVASLEHDLEKAIELGPADLSRAEAAEARVREMEASCRNEVEDARLKLEADTEEYIHDMSQSLSEARRSERAQAQAAVTADARATAAEATVSSLNGTVTELESRLEVAESERRKLDNSFARVGEPPIHPLSSPKAKSPTPTRSSLRSGFCRLH